MLVRERSVSARCLVPKMMVSDLSGFRARPLRQNQVWRWVRHCSSSWTWSVRLRRLTAIYSCVSSAYCCFPLRYNQLFYMSLEWSIEILKTSSVHLWVYPLSNVFFFFVILTWSPIEILEPRSYHQILDINFSKFYFRFPYDLLPSESFWSMNE